MPIEIVIFDVGEVLIEWNPERFYDRVIGEERRQDLFAEVDLYHMNALIDLGHHAARTVYQWADRHPKWGDEIRLWNDRWLEMAHSDIPHSVRLLRALRARGVPVYALSNFGVETFDYAAAAYPFLNEFDRKYVSGHVRTMKPNPTIYEMVEADCTVPPGALLFTDDRRENIEAAQERGWQTHHFTSPQGWADRLVAEGLLTRDVAG